MLVSFLLDIRMQVSFTVRRSAHNHVFTLLSLMEISCSPNFTRRWGYWRSWCFFSGSLVAVGAGAATATRDEVHRSAEQPFRYRKHRHLVGGDAAWRCIPVQRPQLLAHAALPSRKVVSDRLPYELFGLCGDYSCRCLCKGQ